MINHPPENVTLKDWGYEVILVLTDHYAMKKLHIDHEKSIHLQFHKEKEETWYVTHGWGTAVIDGVNMLLVEGDYIHIPPNIIHQVIAGTAGIDIIEASTTELDDVVHVNEKE